MASVFTSDSYVIQLTTTFDGIFEEVRTNGEKVINNCQEMKTILKEILKRHRILHPPNTIFDENNSILLKRMCMKRYSEQHESLQTIAMQKIVRKVMGMIMHQIKFFNWAIEYPGTKYKSKVMQIPIFATNIDEKDSDEEDEEKGERESLRGKRCMQGL